MKTHEPNRTEITETLQVVVGYLQTCAVCGGRFRTAKPAQTCSEPHKRKLARERRKARQAQPEGAERERAAEG